MPFHTPGSERWTAVLARRARFLGALGYRHLVSPDRRCAYCSSRRTMVVGQKWAIMQVRRCADCGLMFRCPKDSERISHSFYQHRYVEPRATDLPGEKDLPRMLADNFSGTKHDRSDQIALLKAVEAPPARVLDFGCSWGYAPYQMKQAGYSVTGFEISQPRAAFGRKFLGIEIIDSYQKLDSLPSHCFQAIYSHHVLEHLPGLAGVFERFARLLIRGGTLLLFAPNCGDGLGNLRAGWRPLVGEKHSMALDTVFFRNVLPRSGFEVVALTSPFRQEELWSGSSTHPDEGFELLVRARLLQATPTSDLE